MLAVGLAAGGCSPAQREQWDRMLERRSDRELLTAALGDARPDERRRAVDALARRDAAHESWAVEAFEAIARNDPDGMVRAAAVRALVPAGDSRCVPTLAALLETADGPVEGVLAAPPAVRWEAALLLARLSAAEAIAESDRERVVRVLLARADRDGDRNVRLAAIAALRWHRDRRVPPALVTALRSRDFAIQHRAEDALYALTGQRFDHDPAEWERWLAATADPFAGAPPSRPAAPGWFERLISGSR